MRKIIIAGTGSGCGKTTVTCGILKALCNRKLKVSSFKCGPDYIDPMFHRTVIGTASYNLDSFFCRDNIINQLLSEKGNNSYISIIEGVMGYYDGTADGRGSAYSISNITSTPAVLVIDCKGMGESIGAVMKGFLSYREKNNIVGFIFNRLPKKLIDKVKKICKDLGTEFLGIMPINNAVIESRHLGLVTAQEISDINEKLEILGELAEENILIDRIIELAESKIPDFKPLKLPAIDKKHKPVIAVARDKAFCFLYDENIQLLEKIGCKIAFFSPLDDEKIPDDSSGIIICGGYPELYAKSLSENASMLKSIKNNVNSGMPVIAECGGFMYLNDTIEDANGNEYKMAGIIHGKAFRTNKLSRFGYVTLTAHEDCLVAEKNEKLPAHEFHYWDSTYCGLGFIAEKSDGRKWECVVSGENIYAGFPHLYFYGCISTAERFVKKCIEFGEKKNG